jgi:hypothetical protein
MNSKCALSDDLTRLFDLSVSIPERTITLVRRHDEVEAILSGARASLIEEDYARWARVLDNLENVCALAAWRSAAEEPVESASRLAAGQSKEDFRV